MEQFSNICESLAAAAAASRGCCHEMDAAKRPATLAAMSSTARAKLCLDRACFSTVGGAISKRQSRVVAATVACKATQAVSHAAGYGEEQKVAHHSCTSAMAATLCSDCMLEQTFAIPRAAGCRPSLSHVRWLCPAWLEGNCAPDAGQFRAAAHGHGALARWCWLTAAASTANNS